MKNTLSVIMTNYNHARFLPETIESVLNQSVLPMEFIIIDDHSTDESINIIESYAQKHPLIKLIKNIQNKGVLYNINKLINLAQGEYFYGISADDKILPGFFEEALSLLLQHPNAAFCCSDPGFISEDGRFFWEKKNHLGYQATFFSSKSFTEMLKKKYFSLGTFTAIIKKSSFMAVGGFIPQLKWHCDGFAMLAMAFRYGLCYIPKTFSIFRVVNTSYSEKGMQQWQLQHDALLYILDILKTSEYEDVVSYFIESGSLALFRGDMLRTIFTHPEHKGFLNFLLLRRCLIRELRRRIGRHIPISLREKIENLTNKFNLLFS